MNCSCTQPDRAGSASHWGAVGRLVDSGHERRTRLAAETALVMAGTLAVIRSLHAAPTGGSHWLLIPGILVTAALVPTWIARREFPRIGLDADHLRRTGRTVGVLCLCVLPVVLLGLWIAATWRLPIPLQPVIAGPGGWLAWLLYQFLYVAVAEEVFFRGYVQANIMHLLNDRKPGTCMWRQVLIVGLSAVCFALAHLLVQGRPIALLTFFPGLLLAWLFIRTRSLLGPILFHGLANVGYGILALTLT